MQVRAIKYLGVFISPVVIFICLNLGGWFTWGGLIYAFILVPILDALLPSTTYNMTKVEEDIAKSSRVYDCLVYLIVPLQYFLVFYTMYRLSLGGYTWVEYVGYISALGLACGIFGINIAHELGHRSKKYEQFLSKSLLLTSLYMHFFIEHNQGHHKNVSTTDDPASSREGEIIYFFFFRSVIGGYLSAWHLENNRLKKQGKSSLSFDNQMIWYHLIQGAFLGLIFALFGLIPMLCFIASAIFGFLTLETVNYIEHYGLSRKKNEYGAWEKTLPIHSWNSNHPFGRILLFELTRHSDHHYIANRPYQVLRHFDESPQMPTGYPGMMVISLIPPLWFWMMGKEIKKLKTRDATLA
ncbi:MAG: alkane 1-monooxygenase [Chitinophagales bacterium]|jgi:alkane 1-monooxygenase